MWPLTVLTGDRTNVFFVEEMCDRFAGSKRSGHNNKVTVFPRWL